jgi:hypothetical protein
MGPWPILLIARARKRCRGMASLALFVSGRDQRVCVRGLNVQLVFRERSGPAVRHERAPGRPLPACHVRSRGPAKASKGARARFLHGCSARTISNAMHRSALPIGSESTVSISPS